MIIPPCKPPLPRDVTPETLFWNRRKLVKAAAASGLLTLAGRAVSADGLQITAKTNFAGDEELTPWKTVTAYNNFYEFGTGKEDPAARAGAFRPLPWTLTIDGEVHKPQTIDVGGWLSRPLEQRIYRFRCVEAWSMVVPWDGIPLRDVLRKAEPTSQARFIAFETVVRPDEMPGQRTSVLDWPYREGLRLDEAMHDLTFLALGVYGKPLPNQNGAPVRLVVPWKYGFKSIKSIVRIRLVREQPPTTWNLRAPREYGFYANVNPDVDHPRWSQKTERRLGDFFRRPTVPFNGYAEQVAGLYKGMDLRRLF